MQFTKIITNTLTGALALLTVPMAITAQPAHGAGFINDAKQWAAASVNERAFYARGLNDSANFVYIDETLDSALIKTGRTRCLVEKKVTASAIANIITTAYEKESAKYSATAPLVVYIVKVGQLCGDVINRQRAQFGLPPQKF